MAFDLIRFYYRETPASKWRIFVTSLASGMTRGFLLMTINAAAANTENGRIQDVYLATFIAILVA